MMQLLWPRTMNVMYIPVCTVWEALHVALISILCTFSL